MFILLTALLLFLTALALLILHWTQPGFRFFWLVTVSGTFLAWVSTFLWQARMPLIFRLSSWQLALPLDSPSFLADQFTWPFAFSLTTLALAVILTSSARPNFPNPLAWSGVLTLFGLGLLAVLADNPLTLVLAWAAIDLAELVSQLHSVGTSKASERVVISFAARMAGIGVLLWGSIVSISNGTPLDFTSTPPQVGLYLILAAGLRLGVLPLHLPYASESSLRRGFGTTLRLVSAASSLVLLARIPSSSLASPLTPFLLVLTALAALYGGWSWLSAPDALAGRPYWIIGLASLAVAASLRANPTGSVAWSCTLILSGGALFLSSLQGAWLRRTLLAGAWGLSALPLSPTASGWNSGIPTPWPLWPFFIAAQALLLAGYLKHARSSAEISFEAQPQWAQHIYPIGIALLPMSLIVLGLWGWAGAFALGSWWITIVAVILAAGLTWLVPRLSFRLPTIQNDWSSLATRSWMDWLYRGLRWTYRLFSRLSALFTETLEGDGGFLWTLLFLVLFFSLVAQSTP
jgi:hypothetical protein